VDEGRIPLDPDSRERLVEASRLATVGRLVASFAHQMSTPLAAIALRAESLEESALEPDRPAAPGKTTRYVHAIGEEAGRCRRLLAALREFGGPLDLRLQAVDLASLCASAALLAQDEALNRQIRLEVELDDPLPLVQGVRGRLGQVVLALLVNALDASPNGGRVLLEARAGGTEVVVAVSDEGDGLAPEARRRLFLPFASSRPAARGLGLGLMACRAVAEAHGGTLELARETRGCRFVFRVPLAGAHDADPSADAVA
jgi:signal transduction histidine kinase